MDISAQMLVFAKVVEMGSISAASRSSGQTPSAVSKQIRHLEDHVGQRLLHRVAGGVSLTEEGRVFYEKCRALAEKFHEAEELISSLDGRPKGTLRVASPVAFGKTQLIPILPEFLGQHPELTLSLELTDRPVDLEEEDFDAAIAFAEKLDKPNVIARKIMENERVLCAAPSYIGRHGLPERFEDLARHNCLRGLHSGQSDAWQSRIDGRLVSVDASGNFVGNSADAVYRAALAGLGIARLSRYIVAAKLDSGELVHVLPDYAQVHADIAVTYADRRNLAPKIRVFVDFLSERIGSAKGEKAA